MDKVAEKASTLSETELKEFFEKRVNFDFISSSLDQHGVTRLLDQGLIKKCRVTNEMVVDLVHFFRKENYSTSTFFYTLTVLSSKPLTYSNKEAWKEACRVEKEHKKLLKNKNRPQLEEINK